MESLTIEDRSYLSYRSCARNKRLAIKTFHQGFISLYEQAPDDMDRSFGSYWMYCAGHSISLCNRSISEETDSLLIENSSSRRKYMRRAMNLIKQLFGDMEIDLKFNSLGVKLDLSQNVDVLSSLQIKGEYYFPYAFTQNSQVKSGAYLNIRQCGEKAVLKTPRDLLKVSPIKEFYTGGCFFGATLYGVDQEGKHHSLTSPYYEIPQGTYIDRLLVNPDLHPDELVTRESLKNLISLMKVLSQSETPVLHYHLPVDNYIIYGLNWYFEGVLTGSTLLDYIREVRKRSDDQWKFLNSLSDQYGVGIVRRNSLDPLDFQSIETESFLFDFMDSLSIDISDSKKDLYETKNLVIESIWEKLKKDKSSSSRFWNIAYEKMEHTLLDSSQDSLLTFNYVDYSASLAASVDLYGDRQVAALLPIQESPVVHFYKKLFSEEIGALLSIQWLPPILVHIPDFLDRIFYLSDYLEGITDLNIEDVIDICFRISGENAVCNKNALLSIYRSLLHKIELFENASLEGEELKTEALFE